MMERDKYYYECVNCNRNYERSEVTYLCPVCSQSNSADLPPKGVLKIKYKYVELIAGGITFGELKNNKFLDLLPIDKIESLPNLNIGNTPNYLVNKIDNEALPFNLFLKDDSQNPTYSFKDRASALVSAYAKENDHDTIVAASTGNAGSSLAGICAAQGQKAIILVPESAPIAKMTQILMYGATIVPVKGNYDDAFDLSMKATEEFGIYNRNTAFNPLTIEGKKTVVFELFEQLNYTIPDRIFVPVGDGVIISGIYKGYEDLLKLNFIDHMPIVVGIQAEKSDNLVRNLESKEFKVENSNTIADSISVDIPRNFYMTRKYVKSYNGEYITVSDNEILRASSILSSNTGLFAEPAAAAAFAGFYSYMKSNKLADNSNNVVMLTGSGLKDLKAVNRIITMPEPIDPTIDNLKKLLA
jgi:threonine synthase